MLWLAEKYMRLRGWRFAGEAPALDKFVAIGVPHTSNWDFMVFLAVVSHFRMPAKAIGKHSLVRWPFGSLMRHLGIIPVRRDTGQGLVEQMAAEFAASDRMVLVVAPEGTRGPAEYWRSGFYRIAVAARVPLVLAFMDYGKKLAGIGPTLYPTGDIGSDMDRIRAFYSGVQAKHPHNLGPMRLSDEVE